MQTIEPALMTTPARACTGDCARCPCLRLLAEQDADRETPIDRAPRPNRTIGISRAQRPRRTISIPRARRAAVRSTLAQASR